MNILAVDDECPALEALISQLKIVFPNENIHGEMAPQKAVEWAGNLKKSGEKLSYAFLDIQMQNMTGLELAHQLKNIYPKVMLFFCTAYSEYAYDAFGLNAKGYLLKPVKVQAIESTLDEMVTDWRQEATTLERDIKIQTFGNFEIFVDGVPLTFERKKAKELLAYLVDRHGASVTTEQIALILWEDATYDRKLKNMATMAVTSLRNTLKSAGIEDILIKTWNHLALDVDKVKCDAYDFEKWDAVAINSFHGEYMSNYSWAEFTTGRYVQMEQKTGNDD